MNLPFGVKTVAFILNPSGVISTPPVLSIRQFNSLRRQDEGATVISSNILTRWKERIFVANG